MLKTRDTVAAICTSIVRERGGLASLADGRLGHAEQFVNWQMASMPDHLQLPFKLLILIFNLISILSSGKSFCGLTPEARRQFLARSRASRIGPVRDLVRFFDALVLFDLCEQTLAPS